MLVFGIDPSARRSALAVWREGTPDTAVETYVTGPIEQLSASPVLKGLAVNQPKVYAVIERPMWTGKAGAETKAAANAWGRVLKATFADIEIHFVQPVSWQSKIHVGCQGETTKEKSVWFARQALRMDLGGDHDRADAACVLHYARKFHMKGDRPKSSKRPKPGKEKVS